MYHTIEQMSWNILKTNIYPYIKSVALLNKVPHMLYKMVTNDLNIYFGYNYGSNHYLLTLDDLEYLQVTIKEVVVQAMLNYKQIATVPFKFIFQKSQPILGVSVLKVTTAATAILSIPHLIKYTAFTKDSLVIWPNENQLLIVSTLENLENSLALLDLNSKSIKLPDKIYRLHEFANLSYYL